MVKRRKALKGAKGSALFMVICIMAILMVVAITAMAMVSLAYTRSLQNYTASQSYVTAVNTLDMIFEATDNTGSAKDYGQSELTDDDDKIAISKPIIDAINKYDADPTSDTKTYGTVVFSGGPLNTDSTDKTGNSIRLLSLNGNDDDTENILYEVMPDPNPAGSSRVINSVTVYYGQWAKDDEAGTLYTFARIKATVKVQSGSGDTAQIRTVSRIQEVTVKVGSDTPKKFTQAVKTMGLYTSGTGMQVLGGLSSLGGGGSFEGLKGNTGQVHINGDFDPVDSGHNGTMNVGAGQQITVTGKFSVNNNFKFNSTYNSLTDSGAPPFIYCDEIDWANSDIPTGKMDIITRNGGRYGRDGNKISGNVLSGGDLELVGNNLEITGDIFVDGDVTIKNSIKGTGTIYVTGTVTGSNNGVKVEKWSSGPKFGESDTDSPDNPDTEEFIVSTPVSPTTTYTVTTNKSVFGQYFEDGDLNNDVLTAAEKPAVVDYAIAPGSTGTIEVTTTEGATTTIYLPAGTYQNMEILVKGGGDVTIYQDGNVDLVSCRVWSEYVKDKIDGGDTINMVETSTGAKDALADDEDYSFIQWEIAKDAKLNIGHIGGNGTFLNAYIYGPDAGIMQTASGTPNGPEVTVYDGVSTQTMKVWLMGAVVGNDLTMTDGGPGIVFINPYGGGDGGDPDSDAVPTVTTTQGYRMYTNR